MTPGRFPDVVIQAKPGVYRMDSASYHRDPCLAPSLSAGIAQRLIVESPLHAWHAHPRLNPDWQADDNQKYDLGLAGHALLFEGIDRMEVIDPKDYPGERGGIPVGWTNKPIKQARDYARAAGKIPVLLEDATNLRLRVNAALAAWQANPDLKGYTLAGGQNEITIIARDDETWLRCRPDHMSDDRRVIIDGKFTDTSANPYAFGRQIERMGYDTRGAFYLACNALTGGPRDARYIYLVQEEKPPFATAFIGLAPAYLDLGRAKVRRAADLWRECLASGTWPGYLNCIHWAEPPTWAITQWEDREGPLGNPYDIDKLWGPPKVQQEGEKIPW